MHAGTERPKTYYASMVHDALFQFLPEGLPLTRRQADAILLRLLRESDFSQALLYWLAVRLFGGFVSRRLRMKRDWKGSGSRSRSSSHPSMAGRPDRKKPSVPSPHRRPPKRNRPRAHYPDSGQSR